MFDPGMQEITDIPDDYLNQSSVLKHLAKEVKVPSPNGTTLKSQNYSPPKYQNWSEKLPGSDFNKHSISSETLLFNCR